MPYSLILYLIKSIYIYIYILCYIYYINRKKEKIIKEKNVCHSQAVYVLEDLVDVHTLLTVSCC